MKSIDDTIVAIITPRGVGGVGLVRLSGENCQNILHKLLEISPNCLAPRRIYHGWVSISGRRIDEVLYYYLKGPSSYTGEDVVEISSHGNPYVINKIVGRAVELGARRAEAGEFTRRAFINGRIDLVQAEAIADLINSQAARGHENAVEQLTGGLSSEIRDLRAELVCLLAEVELSIDYEEEAPQGVVGAVADGLVEAEKKVEALLSGFDRGMIARRGVRAVIIGLPNVGKSSLFNALLANERAIVTSEPGTTRDTIEECVEIEGVGFVLIDSAGIREGQNEAENLGIERAMKELKLADLSLIVTEANRKLKDAEKELIGKAQANGRAILVLNKIDLGLKGNDAAFGELPSCQVSAAKHEGIDLLKQTMARTSGINALSDGVKGPVINERHKECLLRAQTGVRRGIAAIENDKRGECLAADIKEAVGALGEISGEAVSEEVINTIFEKFCVGK